ncbi:MAG TPA: FHA domain-containing protein [Pyrinomonadaceae bacterium]|jgi:pSer/pThr/pTyr-binding forkhead associated (FHA) protein
MASELLLIFADENGETRRVSVGGERFSIGRNAENDLQISNHSLSRRHVEIQRFADVFVLTDANSSNGTIINGETVSQPVALKNGDLLMLGGAVEIEIEVVGNEAENAQTQGAFRSENQNFSSVQSDEPAQLWKSIFLIAPIAGCAVLLVVGALLFVVGGTGKTESNERGQNFPVHNLREISNENAGEEPEETPTPRQSSNENSIVSNSSEPEEKSSPANQSSEVDKTEKYALQFLRRISSDTQAVLTAKQLELVNAKIKRYKSSTALENLRTARRNSATIKSAAEKENLNPDFLTVAALAKLNETRGNAAQTGAAMSEDLGKLSRVLGTELANDCLIVVAAYEEGGSTLAMRDKLQNLTAKTPNVSPAIVRTVWFLKENGKLSDSAFDFVLRFLAIGTIWENPREFGLDA